MSDEQVDNWVFDSLVNFLHGSIWKVPVVGFIEEKSVVFDPDSYNNMTEEKEQEFRKIHEEYKGVVDFMLTSFMEDLQVTAEQVEEACRVREHQSKTLPESHITKVALEQLWAAEDFTAFRRLMTRKNIDLQLQSLELLVAKYGVLAPALRSSDSQDATGDDGEDDFLQVVIRYSDQLEAFKCDYGAGGASQSANHNETASVDSNDGDDERNMKLHLAGVAFKNNVAPKPVHYQATLSSVPPTTSTTASNIQAIPQSPIKRQSSLNSTPNPLPLDQSHCLSWKENKESSGYDETNEEFECNEEGESAVIIESEEHESSPDCPDLSTTTLPAHASPTPPPSPSPPNENVDSSMIEEEPAKISDEKAEGIPPTIIDANVEDAVEIQDKLATNETILVEHAESQLIQLEEADAAIEEESNSKLEEEEAKLAAAAAAGESFSSVKGEPMREVKADLSFPPTQPALSPTQFDEKTAAEIASTAPEQRRLLTAVRRALEINPNDSEPLASIDIPSSSDNDEDLQKRREYLRAQRDKLIAMKKQEREKLLLANTAASSGQPSARPKSARAAQMALKNPTNMRAASLSEKSLSARRALADRLKQELIEK